MTSGDERCLDTSKMPAHARPVTAYLWGSLRFTPPAGMRDDTLVTFTADSGKANVTVARDEGAGAVEPYARAQEQALVSRRLKGYRASLTTQKVGGKDVVFVDREFVDGTTSFAQRQAFVAGPRGLVVIVTGTAAHGDTTAAHRAVDDVVSTLSIDAGASR